MANILRLKEAAEYLKCHQTTLYRRLKQDHIPHFRIGSDYRLDKDALDKWIAEQQHGADR